VNSINYSTSWWNLTVKISKLRNILYKSAKYLGDIDSVKKKRVGNRVVNRIAGKITGRTLFRWINKK